MNELYKKYEPRTLGIKLAHIHRPPFIDIKNGRRMDGRFLYLKGEIRNMPFYTVIKEALFKMDSIVERITDSAPNPNVSLLFNYDRETEGNEYIYGNPAWDLGIALCIFDDDNKAEILLQNYLSEHGVMVTVIELYIGILYAKIGGAMIERNNEMWKVLAENECCNLIQGKEIFFKEISAETLARLGLPGLRRIE